MVLTTKSNHGTRHFRRVLSFPTGNILTTHETLTTPLLMPPVADHLSADTLAELATLTDDCESLVADREATVSLLRSIASDNPAEWSADALSPDTSEIALKASVAELRLRQRIATVFETVIAETEARSIELANERQEAINNQVALLKDSGTRGAAGQAAARETDAVRAFAEPMIAVKRYLADVTILSERNANAMDPVTTEALDLRGKVVAARF